MKDLLTRLKKYESEEMSDKEQVELFQELIDTGVCWQLQGHYGRKAKEMISAGHCTVRRST
jgi:hypothetical protein